MTMRDIIARMARLLLFLFLLASASLFAETQEALLRRHATRMEAFAGEQNPWGITDATLYREYIAPLTSLGEETVDWFPVLRPIAQELSAGARTPLEAAMRINAGLWKRVGVVYSPRRDKANQDPLHSMRIGMASCSGLSILLADACRSVGIPARLVGCQWRNKPGNHTWVEIWSEGAWVALGAGEPGKPEDAWFLADAAEATDAEARYAIYATRATPSPEGTTFWGWGVPADRVTARYARGGGATAEVRVYIAAERNGERVAMPFTVAGKRYVTPGAKQDLNDMVALSFPSNATFTLEMAGRTFTHRATPNAIFVEHLDHE